ncbi:MAG: enoyl-CoA hydratase/isomerase family protein [Candidatus Latescibacteria bacterium]|nr:enoyl-CoA hydratase/isomerase family protein [Candidatus Latescibacterota bacterium]
MPVDLTFRDHIGVLTLNRPEALNALDHRLQADLEAALAEVEAREDLRALIVTGAGRAFCAGSDVKDLYGVSPDEADRIVRREARICQRLADLPVPTLAAIHGYALGGGIAFALYHDIRVAAESARLGCPEIKLGWSTPYGMSLLTRVVGRSKARELLFRGHVIDAREAHRIGLVDEVAPDAELMETAERIAREIAAHSPTGVRALKAVLNAEEGMGVREADDYECRAFRICFDTDEARAGIKDFVEKRRRP